MLALIAGCVALDQATKLVARSRLIDGHRLSFLGDVFRLELTRNSGAFLSLGANLPPAIRGAILTWGVLILAAGATWVALFRRAGSPAAQLGAALVAGGGFGNLWDRLTAHGMVTDFMNLGLGTLRTGIFNVADLFIVAGVVLLVLPHRRPA
jgi:signal peptidase II